MGNGHDKGWYPAPRYLFRKNIVLRFLSKLELQGKCLLEIGYGAGDMLLAYRSLGLKVYGYDFSELAYQEAFGRIQKNGQSEITLLSDLDRIEQGRYDFVAACEVLEHIQEDVQELSKWSDLLKPGGLLILSVPAKMSKWGHNDEWAGHYRRYEREDLRGKLKGQGFGNIEILCYPFPFNLVLDYLLHKEKKEVVNNLASDIDKKAASGASGVHRESNRVYRALSNPYIFAPLFVVQRMFLKTDLGSGYVCFAEKKNGERA